MDVDDAEQSAVGKGQGAPVGRLSAALRVEDRAVQRDLSALLGGLSRKDATLRRFAECIRFVIFFCALHSSKDSFNSSAWLPLAGERRNMSA